jgi:hypothetical protein
VATPTSVCKRGTLHVNEEKEMSLSMRNMSNPCILILESMQHLMLEYYDELESVKDSGLTRPEIIAIVLHTGPMIQIYNVVLRRFGHCVVVEEGTQPMPIMEKCA